MLDPISLIFGAAGVAIGAIAMFIWSRGKTRIAEERAVGNVKAAEATAHAANAEARSARESAESSRKQVTDFEVKLCKRDTELNALNAEITRLTSASSVYEATACRVPSLESKIEIISNERSALEGKVAEFNANKGRTETEIDNRIAKLEAAEIALKNERERVIREDERKRAKEKEEWDRVWAEHEISVIAQMTELCKLPQYGFTHFTNTNLPDGFHGNLKPDFMIDFLGQYIIFDPKHSKAENLQTYINDAVKKTGEKIRKNDKIYPTVFLVVPTVAIGELKKTYYPQDELTFFVVSPETIAPVLYCLKRITSYELAEKMDPQKRENIVSIIAELDFHIGFRNGVDIIMARMGTELLQKAEKMDRALASDVALKRQEKKVPTLPSVELKRLVASTDVQAVEINALIDPSPAVREGDQQSAKDFVDRKLISKGMDSK